jgi:hypothetical protein
MLQLLIRKAKRYSVHHNTAAADEGADPASTTEVNQGLESNHMIFGFTFVSCQQFKPIVSSVF